MPRTTDEPEPTILAEVDFGHSRAEVTLRFYEVLDDRRRLLRTQELYNRSLHVRKKREPLPERGTAVILKSIWSEISRPHVIKNDLSVLKVSRDVFSLYMRAWEPLEGRLIERQSQAPYTRRPAPARMHFELVCHGDKTELSAWVRTPLGNWPYAKVAQDIIAEADQIRVGDRIFGLVLPIPRAVLDKVFSRQPRVVPSAAVAANLPTLLMHRLDLLRGQSVVKERRHGRARMRIAPDGGAVRLDVRVGPAPVHGDPQLPICRIERVGNDFVITRYDCRELDSLRTFLSLLEARAEGPGQFVLQPDDESLARLRRRLTELPDRVEVVIDRELEPLLQPRGMVSLNLDIQAGSGWFDFTVGCSIGDINLDGGDLRDALQAGREAVRTRRGKWVALPREELDRLRRTLAAASLEAGTTRLPATSAVAVMRCLEGPDLRVHNSAATLAERLRRQPDVAPVQLPAELARQLRDYQHAGTEFLHNRTGYGVGCMLADDMGLGKTLQALAYLAARTRATDGAAPSLVVCPASVRGVWLGEAQRFTPTLRTVALTGGPAERERVLTRLRYPAAGDGGAADIALVITTYATVRNDMTELRQVTFDTIICDEAQYIRNPEAQTTQAIKALRAERRIALTGTPLENRVLDLWSIMDFLNPGLLGERATAADLETPAGRARATRRTAPLMLRRTKEQAAPELPPRTEEILAVPMHEDQRRVYNEIIARARRNLREKGVLQVLADITRLRQICCHPELLAEKHRSWKQGELAHASAKLELLATQLAQLREEGHSALVFSQFTSMLKRIRDRLTADGMRVFCLTGATPTARRSALVQEFADSADPAVFLLSLKAAGTGLTLTKADYVYIFDPWWNPAAERQAIDRTHRIGQEKPVIAYRLVAADSVESRVLALQERKRRLFDEVVDGAGSSGSGLSAAELMDLLG